MKGSESPLTEEQILRLTSGDDLLPDGIQLLCYEGTPVGLVRMELDKIMLCVNAENEQALGLYKRNGFTIDESVSCLHYEIL